MENDYQAAQELQWGTHTMYICYDSDALQYKGLHTVLFMPSPVKGEAFLFNRSNALAFCRKSKLPDTGKKGVMEDSDEEAHCEHSDVEGHATLPGDKESSDGSSDSEVHLKPSPKEKKNQDAKDRVSKQGDLGKMLTTVVKKYDSLVVLNYYAAIVGTEISSFPGVGPAITLKALHENPKFSSIGAFTEFLFDLKKTNALDRPDILKAIQEGFDFFDNAPMVYDSGKNVLCELRTRKVLNGTEPVFQGIPVGCLTTAPKEAYHMRSRWNIDDKAFPISKPFQSALDIPYFPPKENTTEMIPGAHLELDSSDGTLHNKHTPVPVLKEFLKTRLVCGISSLTKNELMPLVLQHLKMEQSSSPLITGTHNLSIELLSFMAGRIHAKDLPYFNIPQSLPLHQYLSWTLAADREQMLLLVARTPEDVFEAWSPTTLVDATQQQHLAFMTKAIRMKSARGELGHLTDHQLASFAFCEVGHLTGPTLRYQFSRMAIPASMCEKSHQAFVVTLAKIGENGIRTNVEIVGGHCSCKAGISARDIHTMTLLFLQNNIHNLKIPSDKVACTSMLCQWIIPSSGPCADVKVPMELQVISGKGNVDQSTGQRKKEKQPRFGRGKSVGNCVHYKPTNRAVKEYKKFFSKLAPLFRITAEPIPKKRRLSFAQLFGASSDLEPECIVPGPSAIEAMFFDVLNNDT